MNEKLTPMMHAAIKQILDWHRTTAYEQTRNALLKRGYIENRSWGHPLKPGHYAGLFLTAKGYQYASEQGWLSKWDEWAAEIDRHLKQLVARQEREMRRDHDFSAEMFLVFGDDMMW